MTHGDFSIIRRSQDEKFRKVLFQQGRVLTDADFNDHVNIEDSRETTYLKDIIGKNGIPIEENESFKITPTGGNRFTIGKGRIYVDGLQIKNPRKVGNYTFLDGEVKVIGQPYVPYLTIDDQFLSEAIPSEPGRYLVYLKAFDKLITYVEDPEIQDSALGDVDTSTRIQTTWQVLVHKLLEDDEEIPRDGQNEKNKWAPWIPLAANDPKNNDIESEIRIGTDNKGEFLEVFALSKSPQNNRIGLRQSSVKPILWEDRWNTAIDEARSSEFDIAVRQVGEIDILHHFGLGGNLQQITFNYFLRDDESRWGKKLPGPPAESTDIGINQVRLIKDASDILYVFAFSNKFKGIVYSRQDTATLKWDVWRGAGRGEREIDILKVILNPENRTLEVYTSNKDGTIAWTRQTEPNSDHWTEWKKIELDLTIADFAVTVNKKNQVVAFVNDSDEGDLWSAIVVDELSHSNWVKAGINKPGRVISSLGSFDVRINTKKDNRLEVFGIFSDNESPDFGTVWNISEDEEGKWNSNWESINKEQGLKAFNVTSATDRNSKLHIFAIAKIEDGRRIVHHSYLEDDLMSCDFDIPSWEKKIRPSTWQLKARTKPPTLQSDECLLPEEAGYRSLENQLYRIEIHDSKSPEHSATFKFSRDNGTLYSKITDVSVITDTSSNSLTKITVASIGKDKLLRFKTGNWIEINNRLLELSGKPGILAHISRIEGNEIFCDNTIPEDAILNNDNFPQSLNPTARRWDSSGILNVEIPSSNDGWIDIEQGIQVRFENVTDKTEICRTGDYGTFAARTSKGDIEWPRGEDESPELLGPDGIEYHYAKLAILEYSLENGIKIISDCRQFFNPLVNMLTLPNTEPETKHTSLTSWVHGTMCQVEFPELLMPADRPPGPGTIHGTGSTFRQHNANFEWNWFHFPINVSYPVDTEKKMRLQKIFILFDSNSKAKIVQIDIYKGKFKMKDFAPLDLSGNHSELPNPSNTFSMDEEIVIDQGLGISIKVSFTGETDRAEINFRSVGAELTIE